MSSDARRRVPLTPSYAPLEIVTARRIYIQNLVNLLELSILRGQWERAYRVWAILIRCPEADYKRSWHYGLAILGHLPLALADTAREADLPAERDEKKEAYLRRLLSAVRRDQRPDVLQTLVLELIKAGKYTEALDELELYLPAYPYITAPGLHTYAGLVCFYLALPSSARGGVRPSFPTNTDGNGHTQGKVLNPTARDDSPPSPVGSRSSSASVPSSSPFPGPGLRGSAGPSSRPALDLVAQMDRGTLRRAQGFFQAAVDLEQGAEGQEGADSDEEVQREKLRGGVAGTYLLVIKDILAGRDPTQQDPGRDRSSSLKVLDPFASAHSQSPRSSPRSTPTPSHTATPTPTPASPFRSYRSPTYASPSRSPSPVGNGRMQANQSATPRATPHTRGRAGSESSEEDRVHPSQQRTQKAEMDVVDDEDDDKSQYSDLSYG